MSENAYIRFIGQDVVCLVVCLSNLVSKRKGKSRVKVFENNLLTLKQM
jgi:hypothetical protein